MIEGIDFVICKVCGESFKEVNTTHLKTHSLTKEEYVKKFGNNLISKNASLAKGNGLRGKKRPDHKNIMSGKNNPMFGRKRTKEEKLKISLNRKGKGVGVAGKYKRTFEIRKKISESVTKFLIENPGFRLDNKFYKTGNYYSSKNKKHIAYKSTWELFVMFFLDEHPHVIEWKYEPFVIPYRDELGYSRNYFPDFYVYFDLGIKEIWEVKPHKQTLLPRFKAKMEALNLWLNENPYGIRNGFIVDENWIAKMKTYNFERVDE